MDTSTARNAIMQRIRQAQQRVPAEKEGEMRQARAYLAQPQAGPQPDLGPDLLACFCRQALKMSDTLVVLEDVNGIAAALANYLVEHNLAGSIVAWPQLQQLIAPAACAAAGLQLQYRAMRDGDKIGLTGAFCALAETGSLMLLSGKDSQVATAILPETHIALLAKSRIVAGMEQAFALLQSEHGQLPRTTTMISGPSRTGDIEQTIVLGAHGPYRVHVIIYPD